MYEVLESVSKCKTTAEKIQMLQKEGNGAVQSILKHAFDPDIKFLLPKGEAPFKPCSFTDQYGRLYTEARLMYLFIEGGHPSLTATKRESLFIQLLESIDPNDAKLLCSVKDKKLPFKGITPKIVNEAFPGLLNIKGA